MKCDKCGFEMEDNLNFCTNCGNKLQKKGPTCKKCGNTLKEGASFCTSCGENINHSHIPQDMYCPSCHTVIDPKCSFCTNCGTPVAKKSPVVQKNTQTPKASPQANKTNNAQTQKSVQKTTPVKKPTPVQKSQTEKKNDSKKLTLIILAIILAVALVVSAVFVVYKVFLADSDWAFSEIFGGSSEDYDDNDSEDYDNKSDKDNKKKKEDKDINKIDPDVIEQIISDNTSYTEFGVYVHNLKNNYTFGYKANNRFLSSALAQIVIIDCVDKITADYGLSVDDEEVYFEYIPNGKEAPDSKYENGVFLTVRDCIEDVAIYGDNNKSNLLVDYIAQLEGENSGFDVINNLLYENDFEKTQINRKIFIDQSLIDTSKSPNKTTPKEIAGIFKSLIKDSNLGSASYMNRIFKSISDDGDPIGLKKFIPKKYTSCNVNAITSQCTNDVCYIKDDDKELIIAIMSTTDENKTSVETNADREAVQEEILNYVLETQFAEE